MITANINTRPSPNKPRPFEQVAGEAFECEYDEQGKPKVTPVPRAKPWRSGWQRVSAMDFLFRSGSSSHAVVLGEEDDDSSEDAKAADRDVEKRRAASLYRSSRPRTQVDALLDELDAVEAGLETPSRADPLVELERASRDFAEWNRRRAGRGQRPLSVYRSQPGATAHEDPLHEWYAQEMWKL